ncbi:coiled-coil domain-containing protein 57 isoform X3 [Pezoporus wallicus]|uniref:coiled-coil domain-containing protein 57 isoform X3 n=1 Tax=Pezoporus wallicus TaxID=35540 RepID=UPI00254CEFED|nr:coiled-coil domain-containing protein 57 isoform X3 [Pezoporus wallicus]
METGPPLDRVFAAAAPVRRGLWRYKQMSLVAEQEWILEQNKMQAELDWQHLCENAESNWYQKSEDLTQSLSSAREQIFQYDDKTSLSKNIPTLEMKRLQEQNASLRAAVAQMRKEMESLDKQMSSLPLTENGQLTEQGLLCTNRISTGTTLSNTKVSSVNLDCMVNPGAEKGPKAEVIEQKMVDLEQQFPDIGPGVGLWYGVSGTLQGVQNKLQEAARQISILSEEKQQLIEIGNGLRAELRTVLKEGLLHPVSSKRCTVCVVSGSLFPRELVKRMQCQLSALKHLQHRLTTQDEEAPSGCGEKMTLPSTEVQLDLSIENHGPKQQKADTFLKIVQSQPPRQSPSQALQVQLSSSRAHNFCQGVELEVTHSDESQQNIKAKDKLEMPAADLTIRGTRLEAQQKLKSRNFSYAYPIKPKISSKVAKIRNYNIKD